MGDMGDDAQPQLTKTQLIYQLAKPFADAAAARLQYGPAQARVGVGLDFNSNTTGGISPVVLYAGGAAALGLVIALAMRGRR
jgi:hypothetical protein